MSESHFQLTAKDKADALNAGATASGRAPHLLEKDIWVVWSLATLFQSEFGPHLVFKGGTALSKAYKVITRFSEDVDLTYDIRSLAPDLVGNAADGLDPIPPSGSQQKKWSDKIRRDLLPAWLRDYAHPLIQSALLVLGVGTSQVTEDCIFVDYEPVTPASSYAPPSVKLEFGSRSSGEPSSVVAVQCDIGEFIASVEFPVASPRVMNLTRIFWEKATAAHVYCLQGEKGLSHRFSRHFHDLVRFEEAGHLAEALAAQDIAEAVASHKAAFFAEKDIHGNRINYMQAVQGAFTLQPTGDAYEALRVDYQHMLDDRLLLGDPESFEKLMTRCSEIESKINSRHKT